MKRLLLCFVFSLLVIPLCYGQSSAPQSTPPSDATAAAQAATANPNDIRGAFPTKLVKGLDSKKLKEGDPVICQTIAALHSRSGLMIPSGAKVTGHITQAQARSKGDSNSTLAIVFDKIEVTKGRELPMKGTLQAVAPSLGSSGPNVGPATPGTLGGAGQGDAGSGSTTAGPTTSMQISGPISGTPVLISTSEGALGLKNLQLDKDGVLTSPGKEVKLDNGTQVLIRATISIPVQ